MCYKPEIVRCECIFGCFIAALDAFKASLLLRCGQWFGEQIRQIGVQDAQHDLVQNLYEHGKAPFHRSL